MIVKVQLSLATNADERQVLINNKSCSYCVQLPISACDTIADVMGDTPRAFFKAEYNRETKKIELLERVDELAWDAS